MRFAWQQPASKRLLPVIFSCLALAAGCKQESPDELLHYAEPDPDIEPSELQPAVATQVLDLGLPAESPATMSAEQFEQLRSDDSEYAEPETAFALPKPEARKTRQAGASINLEPQVAAPAGQGELPSIEGGTVTIEIPTK